MRFGGLAAESRGVIFALALLVGSGIGYRVVAGRFARAPDAVPLPRGTLQGLPLEFGDWIGRDVPLEEAVIKSTDTDDHVNRAYVIRRGRESVSLFVGYGVRMRDLVPHRPEVCYPGAGWTLERSDHVELAAVDGSIVPCQIHTFRRSGLDQQRIEVLNYYILDGRYCADVSLLRSEAWKLSGGMTYAVQVQIAAPPQDVAAAGVRDFAAQMAPKILELLRTAIEHASAVG
jgi:EpsI family protein